MSSTTEKEEQDNFKRLKKLVFQVGLPLLRELFVTRYSLKHGKWEETPEFGEKLLKILDGQNNNNNSTEAEILIKYEERQHIQSGKYSKWDYTILQIILTHLDLDLNSPAAWIRFQTENRMIHSLTHVRNKLAHDYLEEEKIPTEEFNKLWNKTSGSCLYLGAKKAEINDIYLCHYNQSQGGPNNSSRYENSHGQGSKSKGGGPKAKSGSSSPPKTDITLNDFIVAALASKTEDENKVVSSSPPQSESNPVISSIGPEPVLCKVKPSIENLNVTALSSTENLNVQNVQLPESVTIQRLQKMSDTIKTIMLPLLHGIFLLVVSYLFLLRLIDHSEIEKDFPHTKWIIFTIISVCLGALRISMSILLFLVLMLKEPIVRERLFDLLLFCYVFSVILFGMLAICFVLTNPVYSTFFDSNKPGGLSNYILYFCLIASLSIEPIFFIFVWLLANRKRTL